MSQNQQNNLPRPDAALQLLQEKVSLPVFFNKLARDYGINPDDNMKRELVELAGTLREAEGQVKEAESRNRSGQSSNPSVVSDINRSLQQAMGQDVNAGRQREKVANDYSIANSLSGDPDIYNSILSIKSAMADEIAEGMANDQS